MQHNYQPGIYKHSMPATAGKSRLGEEFNNWFNNQTPTEDKKQLYKDWDKLWKTEYVEVTDLKTVEAHLTELEKIQETEKLIAELRLEKKGGPTKEIHPNKKDIRRAKKLIQQASVEPEVTVEDLERVNKIIEEGGIKFEN